MVTFADIFITSLYELSFPLLNQVSSGMDYIYSVNGTLFKEISAYPQYSSFAQLIQTQFGGILEHVTSFPITVLVPTNRYLKYWLHIIAFQNFFLKFTIYDLCLAIRINWIFDKFLWGGCWKAFKSANCKSQFTLWDSSLHNIIFGALPLVLVLWSLLSETQSFLLTNRAFFFLHQSCSKKFLWRWNISNRLAIFT